MLEAQADNSLIVGDTIKTGGKTFFRLPRVCVNFFREVYPLNSISLDVNGHLWAAGMFSVLLTLLFTGC